MLLTSSIAVPRSLTGCGISHIGEVSRSDGGAGNSISSVGLCRVFNLLALWALPLYSLTGTQGGEVEMYSSFAFAPILYRTPRHAAGYGRGRGCDLILLLLLSQFFNPSVLRTPPLYFAVHNTGEEDCNAVFFPILFCSAP